MASFLIRRNFSSTIKPLLPSVLAVTSRIPLLTQKPPPPQQQHTRNLSTANMSSTFLDLVAARRSHYPLAKTSPISDAQIQDIVTKTLLHVPSSFNNQTTRIVLLLKGEHEKFWELAKEVLKGIVPGDSFATTEAKLNMFKGAYGSVLFFEDRAGITASQEAYAIYAAKFPIWASQADGMAQFAIWTALEAEGLGANLQHYNPVVDEKVKATWDIPASWDLNAQLVFGAKTGEAGPKAFKDLSETFKVFGA